MTIEKDAFHFAKLALFNVRLLNDFELGRASVNDIESLIQRRCEHDNIATPISLMHQATFLQFSYICIVWLWEQSKAAEVENDIVSLIEKKFNIKKLNKISGPRNLNNINQFLRLFRNAISHGRVNVCDSYFIFNDQSTNEDGATEVQVSWSNLVELSEAVLFSVNEKIYGGSK